MGKTRIDWRTSWEVCLCLSSHLILNRIPLSIYSNLQGLPLHSMCTRHIPMKEDSHSSYCLFLSQSCYLSPPLPDGCIPAHESKCRRGLLEDPMWKQRWRHDCLHSPCVRRFKRTCLMHRLQDGTPINNKGNAIRILISESKYSRCHSSMGYFCSYLC